MNHSICRWWHFGRDSHGFSTDETFLCWCVDGNQKLLLFDSRHLCRDCLLLICEMKGGRLLQLLMLRRSIKEALL